MNKTEFFVEIKTLMWGRTKPTFDTLPEALEYYNEKKNKGYQVRIIKRTWLNEKECNEEVLRID